MRKEYRTRRDGDLKAIARRLLEKEVLDGDELRQLLGDGRVAAERIGGR